MNYETENAVATEAPTLEAAFVRLAELACVSREALVGCLPATKGNERADFDAALAACRALLAPLSKTNSLLGRFLRDERFDGEGEVSPRSLPKEARAALKKGEVVASSDADVWIMVPREGGAVQVSHAHPESFEILGESIAEWLMGEAEALESATKKKSKSSAAKGAGKTLDGKPAIDAALAALVSLSGGKDVGPTLSALKHDAKSTRWKYLLQASKACAHAWSPAVMAALEGRLLGRVLSGAMHDGDEAAEAEEGDDVDGINPVYIHRYPKAAQKPMKLVKPSCFVASSGPEVWFVLWDAKGAVSSWPITVYHAAHDGFETLGTLEAWLTAEVVRLRRLLG